MAKVVLLGVGMQGKAALWDLMKSDSIGEIVAADCTPGFEEYVSSLNCEKIRSQWLDATDKAALSKIMGDADVVLELLPGHFAFPVAQLAAELGVNLVSAMYFTDAGEADPAKKQQRVEDIARLNEMAKEKGIVLLPEFGMDPGIDLVLGNKALSELDTVEVFHSYGAGFPEITSIDNPISYKFTWSLLGVMRSYLRPARIISDGLEISIPAEEMFAASNTHIIDLPELGGPLECFPNGDAVSFAGDFGIAGTVKAMGRYICRWPGHGAFWEVMSKSGFLSEAPLQVGDVAVKPAEVTSAIFGSQDKFFYHGDQRDVGFIRADARGFKNGKPTRIIYQLIDYKDLKTGFTSMQRTVGFPMSIAAQMIVNGDISEKGLIYPMEVPYEKFVAELTRRGMEVTRVQEVWDGNLKP
ncbi:MAG: saccharopine dehydrogenase NADP-binding domain-containing protein [Deltaproteobacteria bacterium]|nr:saccharopine dehydrogenase NADP-binding domain-containing protein [Deltaproteobacteria bacterium]